LRYERIYLQWGDGVCGQRYQL
ncbi:lytic transglycosylase domain-containing protein, partial [Pseudomonas aeruginosa]